MAAADVDPDSLRAFAGDLALYGSRQAEAMTGVAQELEALEQRVQAHVDRCKATALACLRAWEACEQSGTPDGPPPSCGGYASAYWEAKAVLEVAEQGLAGVQTAALRWGSAQQAHAQLLATAVPMLQTGLARRIESLDRYNGWSLSILASADRLRGSRWPSPAAESLESGPAGPEVR